MPPTESPEQARIEFECPHCRYGQVPLRPGVASTCPRCREQFTVRAEDEFVLVEHDGWTVNVAVPGPTRSGEREPAADPAK